MLRQRIKQTGVVFEDEQGGMATHPERITFHTSAGSSLPI